MFGTKILTKTRYFDNLEPILIAFDHFFSLKSGKGHLLRTGHLTE